VSEDGTTWRCKDKTCVGDRVEIVLPIGAVLEPVDNDSGTIAFEAGGWWLTFKTIVATDGKTFTCIHSGDLHDIILPTKLPGYTILRRDIREAKANKGLRPDPSGHQRNTPKGEEIQ
jgi:putative protease